MKTKARAKAFVYATVGVVLFLLLFGVVGGMDCNTIPAGRGAMEGLACVVGAWLCWRKAGWLIDG